MRLFEKTINEGGFISEDIYVPKHVWLQEQVPIPEVNEKLHHFDELKKELK